MTIRRVLSIAMIASFVIMSSTTVGPARGETVAEGPLSTHALATLAKALDFYETLRADLAGDHLSSVSGSAVRLAGGLRLTLAGDALPGKLHSMIEEAAFNAEALMDAEDLPSARIGFGEVSRLILQIAADDRRLVEGWHVFGCPMAAGFEKWIQPTADLENPYMGPSMLTCGGASDWRVADYTYQEDDAPVAVRTARRAPVEEPAWSPGIPGLMMEDVRDHKFLWREIEQLQVWERGNRLTVAEFRSKAIEKTAHFLGFGFGEVDTFAAAAHSAIEDLRYAFQNRQASPESSGVENLSDDLEAAVDEVTAVLSGAPRHTLFAPEAKKWLLKLAFSPKEAKEAREAQEKEASRVGASDR